MRFLLKSSPGLAPYVNLRYLNRSDRETALARLVALQSGFCAYSERYLRPLDSCEIEHFDPRIKGTDQDNIFNWHAVLRWMNAHKARKIEPFLPLPDTDDVSLDRRIRYDHGEFVCDSSDAEARNLIEFLGVNRPEVTKERSDHVQRVRKLRDLCAGSGDDFEEFLLDSPEDLSFPSALEGDLEIPAFALIRRLTPERSGLPENEA